MIHIKLEYNNGFTWSERDGIYVKGFIYKGGSYITGQALCGYFRDVTSVPGLYKKLEDCNGCFSLIIRRDDVMIACDPVRVFPLFYLSHGRDIYISDSAALLAGKAGVNGSGVIEKTDNEPAAREFLATGYVTGNETLLRNIFQVQAGEMVHAAKPPMTCFRRHR